MAVTFWNSTGWIFSLYPECPSDQPLHWNFWELLVWCTCKCQISPYARSIFTQVVIFHPHWTNRIQRAVSAHVTVVSVLVKALHSDLWRSDLDLQHSFLKCHPHFFYQTPAYSSLRECPYVTTHRNINWLMAVHDVTSWAPMSIKRHLYYISAFLSLGPFVVCDNEDELWRKQAANTLEIACLHVLVLRHLRTPTIFVLFCLKVEHEVAGCVTNSQWGSSAHAWPSSRWIISAPFGFCCCC